MKLTGNTGLCTFWGLFLAPIELKPDERSMKDQYFITLSRAPPLAFSGQQNMRDDLSDTRYFVTLSPVNRISLKNVYMNNIFPDLLASLYFPRFGQGDCPSKEWYIRYFVPKEINGLYRTIGQALGLHKVLPPITMDESLFPLEQSTYNIFFSTAAKFGSVKLNGLWSIWHLCTLNFGSTKKQNNEELR